MTFLKEEKLNNLDNLYLLDKIQYNNSLDEDLLMIDPSIQSLQNLANINNVVLILTKVLDYHFKIIHNVKKVLLLEDMESLVLESRGFKNFEIIKLPTHNKETTIKNNKISIMNSIKDIDIKLLNIIINVADNLEVDYYGYKSVYSHLDFEKLMKITYSNVKMKPFPIIDVILPIIENTITLDTSDSFPISAYRAIESGNLGILFGTRYRSWVLTELQNPTKAYIIEMMKDNKKYEELVERQSKLFNKYFDNFKNFEEII